MMKGWPDITKTFTYGIILLIFAPAISIAQVPVINLNDDIDGNRVTDYLAKGTTSDIRTPEIVWDYLSSEADEEYDFGFTTEFHWAAFTAVNKSDNDIWVVEIQNPHINFIRMYARSGSDNEWILLDDTGRATPFSTRRVAHFNFVLPINLEYGDQVDLLIMMDKRRSAIQYHMNLWSVDRFNQSQQLHYASYGIYFGMFSILLLVMLIAFSVSRNLIFFLFGLYVLSVGLFVFNDTGLAHQYLYPWSDNIGRFARIALTFAMIFTFVWFTQQYYNTRRLYPGIHKVFNVLLLFVFSQIVLYSFFGDFYRQNATPLIILLYAITLSVIGLAIYTSVLHLKIEKQVSALFIASFSFIFVASILFILQEFGFLPEFQILFTPIQIGSALQIIFLGIALAWRVRVVELNQFDLKNRINKLQTENLLAFINGSEKERNRIAMELHDAIGNRLGHIKRSVKPEKEATDYVQKELTETIKDVRSISHKLAPPSLSLTGIDQSLRQLIRQTDKNSKISYQYQSLDLPDDLPEDLITQLYRIVQEAIQNIEKHSNATSAEIQLICHSSELVLTIEDDGVGFHEFNIAKQNSGIGIDNIRKRVRFLNGSMEITGMKNRGVQLVISLPLNV